LKIGDFRNRHAGQDVFIYGSGPSLHSWDPSTLNGRACIAVNGGILKHKTPTYYLTSDGSQTIKHHWKYVQAGIFPVFYSSQGAGDHIRKFGPLPKERCVPFQKEHTSVMDKNADKIIWGFSSAHCAVHLAVIMGAKRIIVLGCDCRRGPQGQLNFYDYPGEEKDFYPKGKTIKSMPIEQASGAMITVWREIKAANPQVNIVARGGLLESVYPIYKEGGA